jgi:[ribosomal protein S18]-alanine N-acetyltransferase
MNLELLNARNISSWLFSENQIIDFLFQHLQEYGDPKNQISACLDFCLGRKGGLGGFAVIAHKNQNILGVTIVNHTGMQAYIPSNILVYIAVDESHRGRGIGKSLMEIVLKNVQGGIALHVEPDNPARKLYEKLGFTNKYLEMRWNP